MPRLRDSMRGFPPAMWSMAATVTLAGFSSDAFVFLTPYVRHLGRSPELGGLAVGGYFFGAFLAAQLGGQLADRIGRKATIALSALPRRSPQLECLS